MIDTIVLTFEEGKYAVSQPDNFEPSFNLIKNRTRGFGSKGYIVCKNNPSKFDFKKGFYRPRISITRRHSYGALQNILKVEFSAPKMLYRNNFDELNDSELTPLVRKIQSTLNSIGVHITADNIQNAKVSSIHYSKNFVFTDGTTTQMYMNELKKAEVTTRLDSNHTDFRNEGHSFKFRTNSFEIAFYDKMRDLEQTRISPKRTEEKEENLFQIDIFKELDDLRRNKHPIEILRFEVRLNQRKKINQVLNKLGICSDNLTLTELFSSNIAQSVLTMHYNQIRDCYPKALLLRDKTLEQSLSELLSENPHSSVKDILATTAFTQLCKEMTPRDLKRHFKGKARSWATFRNSVKALNFKNYPKVFDILSHQLKEFKLIKRVDFKPILINNESTYNP
jgi:hypothetical protein